MAIEMVCRSREQERPDFTDHRSMEISGGHIKVSKGKPILNSKPPPSIYFLNHRVLPI